MTAYVAMNAENHAILAGDPPPGARAPHGGDDAGFRAAIPALDGPAPQGRPEHGVFLQITSDDAFDLAIPGETYTFGQLKGFQAQGDFAVLAERHRRALRVHLGPDVAAGLRGLLEMVKVALD